MDEGTRRIFRPCSTASARRGCRWSEAQLEGAPRPRRSGKNAWRETDMDEGYIIRDAKNRSITRSQKKTCFDRDIGPDETN